LTIGWPAAGSFIARVGGGSSTSAPPPQATRAIKPISKTKISSSLNMVCRMVRSGGFSRFPAEAVTTNLTRQRLLIILKNNI
jgi:hypothetical protein